jgi:hypothetical protein
MGREGAGGGRDGKGREGVQLLLDKIKAPEIEISNTQAIRSLLILNRIKDEIFITLY